MRSQSVVAVTERAERLNSDPVGWKRVTRDVRDGILVTKFLGLRTAKSLAEVCTLVRSTTPTIAAFKRCSSAADPLEYPFNNRVAPSPSPAKRGLGLVTSGYQGDYASVSTPVDAERYFFQQPHASGPARPNVSKRAAAPQFRVLDLSG